MTTASQSEIEPAAPLAKSMATATGKVQVYGSFFLGERELAIPADRIKQVVELPEQWISLPQSPPFIRGAFDLRGTLITVVELGMLFDAPESTTPPDTVAVVEFDDQCIAFLFDRTGMVFKGVDEEYSEFQAATRNAFVCGVFRRESGARPVQVLDLKHLFGLANVSRDVTGYSATDSSNQLDRRRRSKFMSFLLGDTPCALPISEVQEVFEIDCVTRTALSGGACLGTTKIRGGTIPIIDLANLLGDSSITSQTASSVKGKKVIVMKHGTALFGLVVDSIQDIIAASQDELVAFPTADLVKTELFLGCIVTAGFPDVLLFNADAILSHREVGDVSRIHGQCPSSLRLTSDRKKGTAIEKKEQFLTFCAGSLYAVRIKEIQEIIDLPPTLLQPPGMPSSFSGVHLLRGKTLAPVADLRDQGSENSTDGKVLIFQAEGGKAGLIVDSIDSIASVPLSNILEFPSASGQEGGGFSNMVESIPSINKSGKKIRTSVFKMQALFESASAQA